MIGINAMLKLTKGHGHKVKGQGQTCNFVIIHKSNMDDRILMVLTKKIDVYETGKLTQGQGQKVKGQGQTCNYTKNIILSINCE